MNRIVNTKTARTTKSTKSMRTRAGRLLGPVLSLSLLACQAAPVSKTALPEGRERAEAAAPLKPAPIMAPAVAPLQDPVQDPVQTAAPVSLSARLERVGQHDRIIFNLPPELTARKGFRSQAVVVNPNLEPLRFLRIFVTGPGIPNPIVSSAGTIDLDLDEIPTTITLANVPRGPNRVIVAQFYDDAMNPLDYAAPMGIYSSGDNTANIQIRRQFSLLGRVILGLIDQGQAELARSLDTAALQAAIDEDIYTTVPPANPNVYAVDPAFIDGAALAAEIVNQAGNFSGIDIKNPGFRIQKSSLSLDVSGLVSGSNLSIRVHAPFVAPVSVSSDQTATLTQIPPGNWRVTVASQSYAYPNASFGALPLTLVDTGNGMPEADLGVQSFTPGTNLNLGALALRPALSVNALTTASSRTGQTLNLSGTGFNPVASTNTVSFTKADASPAVTNASSFAGSGETAFSVTVPALPEPGVYSVSVNGQSAGNLLMNVWMVSPTGSGSGLGWASASSLQNALANAGAGDEIWIKGGTYKPHASDRTVSFAITRNLTLLGGFDGTAIDGSRDPDANPVTLSGDLAGNDVSRTPSDADADRQDNSHHVLQISSDTTLEGLTISGGHAYDAVTPPVSPYGGGILLTGSGSALHLNEVRLVENHAGTYGGGLMANDGTILDITDGAFQNNSASTQYGGGLYAFNAVSTISGSSFLQNVSKRGGGAAFENGSLTMSSTRFTENDTSGSGGGLFVNYMSGSFDLCDFVDNQAAGSGGGAEIMDFGGTMNHSEFFGNTAALNGGGMYQHTPSSNSYLNLSNTGFEGNSATGNGGALYFDNASPALTSSAFGLNSAANGGGIFLANGSAPVLRHCTLANNAATTAGRQVSFASGSAPVFANTIIWTGSGAGAEVDDSSTGEALIQNSIVTGLAGLTLDPGSSNNLDANPLLVNAASPGGADSDFGTDDDGFRLPIGASPAIDMGLELLVTSDIRGKARSGSPDTGAYEAVP